MLVCFISNVSLFTGVYFFIVSELRTGFLNAQHTRRFGVGNCKNNLKKTTGQGWRLLQTAKKAYNEKSQIKRPATFSALSPQPKRLKHAHWPSSLFSVTDHRVTVVFFLVLAIKAAYLQISYTIVGSNFMILLIFCYWLKISSNVCVYKRHDSIACMICFPA